MARRWQMRTWTKGTGATVEPAGADDRPLAAARPGGLTALPSKRPWAAGRPRPAARLPQQRISGGARRRHALGYLDPAAVERLEALESQLGGESSDDPTDLEQVAAARYPLADPR